MIPSGKKILVGTQNGNVDLFDDKGNRSWSYATNPAGTTIVGVREVALSTDGKIAAAGTYEGKIVVLDATGKELWANMTKDHINHIAMSGDGSLVVATGDETVYAFSTSSQPLQTIRSPQITTTPVQQKNVTTIPVTTATKKSATTDSSTRAITSEPTPYSVIRTATQSEGSAIIPFLGVIAVVLLIVRRRG
jgi:WD40 repeat protein